MGLELPQSIVPPAALAAIVLPAGITVDCIHAQVQRILESGRFATSRRHCQLLRYLLSQTLEGRGGQLKEYVLGVEVFDRGDSFDPQTDAIVRTELSRLRAKLTDYYASEGRNDPLIVDLPKKRYTLACQLNPSVQANPTPKLPRGWLSWKHTIAATLVILGLVGLMALARPFEVRQKRLYSDLTSVAVLPFVNLSNDPEVEHFSDGLTDQLIDCLAQIGGLRVSSRASVLQFKGKRKDIWTIAAHLKVGVLLEGSVGRSGNRLRITARLVSAIEGHQLTSIVYERGLGDVLGVQEAIARQVANTLRIHHAETAIKQFTNSAEAYDLYLQGRHHSYKRSESELRRAINCYERAVVADSNYGPAYAGLADSHILLVLAHEAPPREAMQRAKQAALNAVRTGEAFSHAHTALGSVLALYDRDWAAAEKEFRRALELDPNDSAIREVFAIRYLLPRGQLLSALFEMQLADGIDPFSPQIALSLGKVHYFKRDSDRAIQTFQKALALDPSSEVAPLALSVAFVQKSLLDQARIMLQEASVPTEDEARLAVLGQVHALSRRSDRARQVLQQLSEIARQQYVSGYYFALIHLALDETSEALGWLEKAATERCPLAVYLKVDPQFDSLRAEPRFVAILKGLGLGGQP